MSDAQKPHTAPRAPVQHGAIAAARCVAVDLGRLLPFHTRHKVPPMITDSPGGLMQSPTCPNPHIAVWLHELLTLAGVPPYEPAPPDTAHPDSPPVRPHCPMRSHHDPQP
ncbi:hypothetical protein GCM10023259_056390 [Thermocatellispora tengchongensis]